MPPAAYFVDKLSLALELRIVPELDGSEVVLQYQRVTPTNVELLCHL